jgi:hypothetical protein
MIETSKKLLKLSNFEYFSHYYLFCKKKTGKESQLQYTIQKLKYHLEVTNIIKKLIEVDKLKLLLFDKEQMELFEYLPKPTIKLTN